MGKLLNIEKQHSLVEAIKENDQKVLKLLYQSNYRKVERFIVKNSGSMHEAKDIFQESFLAMYQNVKASKFVPSNETALQGYLFTIAKNKWRDHLRTTKFKKTNRISDGLGATLTSNDRGNLEEDELQLKINNAIDAFNKLGEECKDLLTLFYFNKKSMRDIAGSYNLTEASARNKKYRCLQHLKILAFKKSNEH